MLSLRSLHALSAILLVVGYASASPVAPPAITPPPRLSGATLAPRADATTTLTTTITTSIFPGGAARGPTRMENTLPLACVDGCWYHINPYMGCFRSDTLPPGSGYNTSAACGIMCDQAYYAGLSACLNCIVANGEEKPYGWTANTSITAWSRTAEPTTSGRTTIYLEENPRERLDVGEANAWLRNVTQLCSSRSVVLSGEGTVTAVPTTTGPYYATWASGEVISRTAWTGLAQFSAPVLTYTFTFPSSAPTASSIGAGGAAQSSQAAAYAVAVKPGGWVVGGALLAWAVL